MKTTFPLLASCCLLLSAGCGGVDPAGEILASNSGPMEELPAAQFRGEDWPWWRGPSGNGVAADQSAPTTWSETQNVVWKADVPGRGHASPTVLGDRIFLATADEGQQTQSVVCFHRDTGEQLWQTNVHEGNFVSGIHHENTHASGTVACDGGRLFVLFPNSDAIWLTALDLDGNELWQRKLGAHSSRFGYGGSPILYKSYVIAAADHGNGGYLAAVHRKTGKIRWRRRRQPAESYATPALYRVGDKDLLVLSGGKQVVAYDPDTGDEHWSTSGTADTTINTVVHDGEFLFAGGGYPENETLCLRASSGQAVWRNSVKIYTCSMVAHDGYLYAVRDSGVAHCWKADTGKQQWQARLSGDYRSSLVLAGGHLYISSMGGKTTVFKADPKRFDRVSVNQTGNEILATPAICGGRIYLRAADDTAAGRRETLYCIGQ